MPRFEDEVVDDYLEAAHAIGDHLLKALASACDELGVAFYLTSGTLLGAVRQGDWIPWDDDVDVIVFREDYERLRRLVSDVLPDGVAFSSPEDNQNHITIIPRLLYLDSRRVHVGRARAVAPMETLHVPLDIFILDRAPRSRLMRWLWAGSAGMLEQAAVARYTSLRDVLSERRTTPARKALECAGVVLARLLRQHTWHALRTRLVTLPARLQGSGPFVATNYSTPSGAKNDLRA